MSHVRNVFETSLKQRRNPAAATVAEFPETVSKTISGSDEIPAITARIQAKDRVIVHSDPGSLAADRFRFLRIKLRERWPAGRPKTLLVTSPLAHDGKSTIALNLATALCEHGKYRVLLVEADLHHACLTQQLGLAPWPGLAECLQEGLPPAAAIRRVEPLGCYLLPGGEARGNPTDLLQTSALASIMGALAPQFDWILVDAPPIIPVTDPLLLRQQTSGSLLVVRAGVTPEEAVEEAIGLLGKQHLFGVVLNGVEEPDRRYSKYPYHDRASGL